MEVLDRSGWPTQYSHTSTHTCVKCKLSVVIMSISILTRLSENSYTNGSRVLYGLRQDRAPDIPLVRRLVNSHHLISWSSSTGDITPGGRNDSDTTIYWQNNVISVASRMKRRHFSAGNVSPVNSRAKVDICMSQSPSESVVLMLRRCFV
jgi:hypothetical protein